VSPRLGLNPPAEGVSLLTEPRLQKSFMSTRPNLGRVLMAAKVTERLWEIGDIG